MTSRPCESKQTEHRLFQSPFWNHNRAVPDRPFGVLGALIENTQLIANELARVCATVTHFWQNTGPEILPHIPLVRGTIADVRANVPDVPPIDRPTDVRTIFMNVSDLHFLPGEGEIANIRPNVSDVGRYSWMLAISTSSQGKARSLTFDNTGRYQEHSPECSGSPLPARGSGDR